MGLANIVEATNVWTSTSSKWALGFVLLASNTGTADSKITDNEAADSMSLLDLAQTLLQTIKLRTNLQNHGVL